MPAGFKKLNTINKKLRIQKTYKFLIAVLATGCFFLLGCENSQKDIDDLFKKKIGVEEAKDIEVIYTSAGKTKSILTAPLMLRVQDTIPYYEFPNSITANFYNDKNVVESKLTSKYAKYKETQSVIFLKDSVKVINIAQGDTLYCQELYWDRSRLGSEFYTDKPVRIRTRTQILDGIGLQASQDFKQRVILKPTGIIAVPQSQFPQ